MPENNIVDFSLPATGGQTFTLSGARGKHLVIYFYPKDNTPGCATEAQQFRDLYAKFQGANCTVAGISRDSMKSHENFKDNFPCHSHCFPTPMKGYVICSASSR